MNVLMLPRADSVAWPDATRAPTQGWAVPLLQALVEPLPFDGHLTQYAPLANPTRLKTELFALPGAEVRQQLLIHDFDDPVAHETKTPARVEWRAEFARLAAQLGTFVWWSRGGAKALWLLPEPVVLRNRRDCALWKIWHECTAAYLLGRFGVVADLACADWGRLFRVPHATRRGNAAPDAYGTLAGRPEAPATWTADVSGFLSRIRARRLEASPAASAAPRPYPPGPFNPYAAGLLATLLAARGWLGRELQPGKWACRCPSSSERGDHGLEHDSCVIWAACWAADPSATLGWLHCSHNRCRELTPAKALAYFAPEEIAAAQRCVTGL